MSVSSSAYLNLCVQPAHLAQKRHIAFLLVLPCSVCPCGAGGSHGFLACAALYAIGNACIGASPLAYAADVTPANLGGFGLGMYRCAGDLGTPIAFNTALLSHQPHRSPSLTLFTMPAPVSPKSPCPILFTMLSPDHYASAKSSCP